MADAELPEAGRKRAGLSALLAASTGAMAIRALVRGVAKGSLGPVGLLITVGEAAIATRSAVRALSRWRAGRRAARRR